MNKRSSITREQANKILEMCKDMFPEYSNIRFVTRWSEEFYFDSTPPFHVDPHDYHWFELCTTELPRVIIEKINRIFAENKDETHFIDMLPSYHSGGELLYSCQYEGVHIVDQLYKEYKKLKTWESMVKKIEGKAQQLEIVK